MAANWEQVKQILAEALSRPVAQRQSFVATACAGQPELQQELQRLLEVTSHGAEFLEAGALQRPTDHLLEAGSQIERFMVVGCLGQGGMGVVYRAYDPKLDRPVALKLLRAEGGGLQARAYLEREAQALARLSHPNVVAVYDVGTFDDRVYVAMELVEGQTLKQWLAHNQPDVPSIVAVFAQAGSGLMAAHQAGLVHRDFKPSNVMVDPHGRAQVLDFGLARNRRGDDIDVPTPAEPTQGRCVDGERLLSRSLTASGLLLGTPEYMAPEQLRGEPADPRTDQFNYCAAFYEALYGSRPFAADDVEGQCRAIEKGVGPRPKRNTVPGWLHDVVARGLAFKPEERFASMQALLTAVTDSPRRQTTRRRAFAVLLAAGMAAATLLWFADTSAVDCEQPAAAFAQVWDEPIRGRLFAAFAATPVSHQRKTAERVARHLDDYAADWAATYRSACEDTHKHRTQSSRILDVRMACLRRRKDAVAALTHLLVTDVGPPVVQRSVRAVLELPAAARCGDIDALTTRAPPPEDPKVQRKVDELRRGLAQVNALEKLGKYRQGLARAQSLQQQSGDVSYPPVAAEALFLLGRLQERNGQYKVAEQTLRRATELASFAQHPSVHTRAYAALLWTMAVRQKRLPEASAMAEMVDERVVGWAAQEPEWVADYLQIRGAVFAMQKRFDKAQVHFERALALREASGGPAHPSVAAILNNLGNVFGELGQFHRARDHFERALATTVEALGREHPMTAQSLNNLANVHRNLGELDAAAQGFEQALAILRTALGPKNPRIALSLYNLGEVRRAQKDYDAAAGLYEQALALLDGAFGPGHPDSARAMDGLGHTLREQNKPRLAADYHRRALNIREAKLGPEHPLVADSLVGLGRDLLAQQQPAAAREPLERAVRLLESHHGDKRRLATTRFALARALWADEASRARGVSLAQNAREVLAGAAPQASEVAQIDSWLSAKKP